jgi:hypothetical protein
MYLRNVISMKKTVLYKNATPELSAVGNIHVRLVGMLLTLFSLFCSFRSATHLMGMSEECNDIVINLQKTQLLYKQNLMEHSMRLSYLTMLVTGPV